MYVVDTAVPLSSPFKRAEISLADGEGCHNNTYLFRDQWIALTGMSGNAYNKAISDITDRANWNSGWACRIVRGTDCYDTGMVECVLNAYTNLVKSGKIPVYTHENSQIKQKVELTIQANTQIAIGRVQRIMAEVWAATKDGSIPGFVIDPVTAEKTKAWGTRPDDTAHAPPTVPNPLKIAQGIIKYSPYIVIGGCVLVAGYYLSKGYGVYRMARGITS